MKKILLITIAFILMFPIIVNADVIEVSRDDSYNVYMDDDSIQRCKQFVLVKVIIEPVSYHSAFFFQYKKDDKIISVIPSYSVFTMGFTYDKKLYRTFKVEGYDKNNNIVYTKVGNLEDAPWANLPYNGSFRYIADYVLKNKFLNFIYKIIGAY